MEDSVGGVVVCTEAGVHIRDEGVCTRGLGLYVADVRWCGVMCKGKLGLLGTGRDTHSWSSAIYNGGLGLRVDSEVRRKRF